MKGYVYSIRSHQTKDIYIGSTKDILSRRLAGHRYSYKQYLNGTYPYLTSFEIIKYEDAYIELIELIEYTDKNELIAREGHHIRIMDCVNKHIPNRTKKEYNLDNKEKNKNHKKQYYLNNHAQFIEKGNQYRLENREQINEKQKEKITCDCGSIYSKSHKLRHEKTKKHITFLEQNKI
jgi:hypothetical protein